MVNVELVFVTAEKKLFQKQLSLALGATVAEAIAVSGIEKDYPEITTLAVGIFSKSVTSATVLRSGDRVEFYRELTIDPKQARRQRSLKRG
jgi:putative ubiquitin-RnfH superfamily antitoxin RatB of RatAB toxin-antitoxin module